MQKTERKHESCIIGKGRRSARLDEHRRVLFSTLAALAFLVSALSVGIVLIDDADAAGTWEGESPSGSSAANPYDAIDIDISGTNVPVLSDVYVSVGASVSITGCTSSWSHGSSNYTYNFTAVSSGYGLSVSTSGDTSVSGTISKAGNITVSYHYVQSGGSYERDENRSFVIHAVDPDEGGVQSISIRGSISSGTISTGGTITLTATTSPSTADNRHVEWSISSGSQYGKITRTTDTSTGGTCVVQGNAPGRVVVLCESEDGYASETFVITVNPRLVTSIAIYQGFTDGNNLIITADAWPTNAYNPELSWSVTEGSNLVRMEESDEYTNDSERRFIATGNGTGEFTVRVSATDGSGVYEERSFYVSAVSFDANGGSNAPSDVYKVSGSTNPMAYLPDQEPTRSGYAFMGWCTSSDGSGALYNAGSYTSFRDGSTFYAIWGLETSIYYHVTLGTGGPTEDSIIIMEGDSDWFYISDEIPYRAGFTFLGWSEAPSASVATYTPGQGISIEAGTEEINLYDVWTVTINNYILHYDANGGDEISSSLDQTGTNTGETTVYKFTINQSLVPTREGWHFDGWSTSPNGPVNIENEHTVTQTGTTTIYAIWTEWRHFTLAYDANNGFGAPDSVSKDLLVDTWETVVSSVVPTWDELHIFRGWSTDLNADPDSPGTELIMPGMQYTLVNTGTTTLYAIWEELDGYTLTITFDLRGGVSGPSDQVFVSVTSTKNVNVTSETPTWDEYHLFLGWTTDKDSEEVEYLPGAEIRLISGTTTLYAVWDRLPMPYSLHFNLNGGSWTASDQFGETAEETYVFVIPDVYPTLEGHGFLGWSTSDGGEVEYDPGDTYETSVQDSTLYAVWQPYDLFTLNFDTAGGSTMDSLTGYNLGSFDFTIPTDIPTYAGQIFMGWASAQGGAADIQPGQKYTSSTLNATIYAVWVSNETSIQFTLRFDAGDGTGAPSDLHATSSGGVASFIVPSYENMSLEGYVCMGWSTSYGGDVEYEAGDRYESRTVVSVLYAVWVEESKLTGYTVTFDAVGGDDAPEPLFDENIDGYAVFDIPDSIPSRNGYVFMGWAISKDPSTAVYSPGDSIRVDVAQTVLYAVWQCEDTVFSLSFQIGDGASNGPSTITMINEGTTCPFTIPDDTPSMSGYEFRGWSTTFGGDVEYVAGDVFVSGARESTLYAVWKLIEGVIQITSDAPDRTDVGTQYTFEVFTNIQEYTVSIGGSAADWLNVNGHTIRGTPYVPGTYTLEVKVVDGDEYRPITETYVIRVMETDKWEYRIDFVTSGGTPVEEQWIVTGGTATEPMDPVRDGFHFGGWYTSDGSKYDFSNPVNSDMTLKAVWIGGAGSDDVQDGDDDWSSFIWIVLGVVALVLVVAAIATRVYLIMIPAAIVAILAVASYFVFGGSI